MKKSILRYRAAILAVVFTLVTILPVGVFSAAYNENYDDGIGTWTAGSGATVEQVNDIDGVGKSVKISKNMTGVHNTGTLATYTFEEPIATAGVTTITFRVKFSENHSIRKFFRMNNNKELVNFHESGSIYNTSSQGANKYDEPTKYKANVWHDVRLVINDTSSPVFGVPGGRLGVFIDGETQYRIWPVNAPEKPSQITSISWTYDVRGNLPSVMEIEMDDLKVYSSAGDKIANATGALYETFDTSPLSGMETVYHGFDSNGWSNTGILGKYVTTREANMEGVADPSKTDRSLFVAKRMTPVETTYGSGKVALLARKTLDPVPMPESGTATIEFDAKLPAVNSTNPGGNWIDRLLLVNDTWSYGSTVLSGLPITFSSSVVESGAYKDKYAIMINGQPVTTASGDALGYLENEWNHYKLELRNEGTSTFYKLTFDEVVCAEGEYTTQMDAIRNIGWANDKKKDSDGTMNVGIMMNNLKIYSSDLPFVAPEAKPAAWNVHISGDAYPTGTLNANYTFYHMFGNEEGTATYRWLKAASVAGPFNPVNNKTEDKYPVESSDVSTYIKCEVTLVDSNGVAGAPFTSAPVKITEMPVIEVPTADETAVATAKEELNINVEKPDEITDNLTLPSTVGDVSVTWKSDNVRAISDDGKVTRDVSDAEAYLTATLKKGDASDTKIFRLRVKGIARPGTATVDLSAYYNQDKYGFAGDKEEWRYNAKNLYRENVIRGIPYSFGPLEGDLANAILAAGQTIDIPDGNYKVIYLLGSGKGNNDYKVHYTDGSSQNLRLTEKEFMDWMAEESRHDAILRTGTAIGPTDGAEIDKLAGMFVRTLYLTEGKTVDKITLPQNYSSIYAISTSTEEEPESELVKIAFIGDSITYGAGCTPRFTHTYPYQLLRLLGGNYKVYNYGVSGATMTGSGNNYKNTGTYKEMMTEKPNIVVIMLGTNDGNKLWGNAGAAETYKNDYRAVISALKELESKPKIYTCYPPGNGSGQDGMAGVIKAIDELNAEDPELTIIDINTPTKYDMTENFPDGLHPNADGQLVIAQTMYQTLKDYGKEAEPEQPLAPYTYEFTDKLGAKSEVPVAGGGIKVTAAVDNTDAPQRDAMLVTAIFDENDKILEIAEVSIKQIDENVKDTIYVSFTLPASMTGKTIKSFLWVGGTNVPFMGADTYGE